jgi:hypothetical protein
VVVAVVNPTQPAPALTAWQAVAVVVRAVTVVAVVVDLAAATAVVAEAAVVVADTVVVVAAVAAPSAADQFTNCSSAIGTSMIGNGPVIEVHVGAAQCAVLGHPAPHSGPPHFERA